MDYPHPHLSRRAAQQLQADGDEIEVFADTESLHCDLSLGPEDEVDMGLQDADFLAESGSTSTFFGLTQGAAPRVPLLDVPSSPQVSSAEHLPFQCNVTADIQDQTEANSSCSASEIPCLDIPATQQSLSIELDPIHVIKRKSQDDFDCTAPKIPSFDVPATEQSSSAELINISVEVGLEITETSEVEEPIFGDDYFWNYVWHGDESISVQGFSILEGLEEGTTDSDEAVQNEEPGDLSREASLYPGASITAWESLVSILSFSQSINLSGVGLGSLLTLLDMHLPQPNNFVKSKHSVFKMIEHLKDPIQVHHFCSVCYKTRKSVTDLCNSCTDETRSVEFFITFPLAPQLGRLFQRPDFVQNLRYNQLRKNDENHIKDIFDGHLYRAAAASRTTNEITFMWNTDGVPVFKSNTFSLWPFYLVTVELPPDKRFLTENLLIAGIWGSTVKPHPNVYLLPIYKELEILKKGIDVTYYGESVSQIVVCSVLCGTCDAPATAAFLNMKTHSGFYSCPVCVIKGCHPGDSTVFLYEENVPLRNMDDYKRHVQLAVAKKVVFMKTIKDEERFCGIRGPTILSKIVDNIFGSMAIDSMHCLYLGIMRQMFKIWFDGKYSEKAKLLSLKILQLAPPDYFQRVPQAIEKLVHWKATELRNFLFNLAMVLLKEILDPYDYNHFSLFVKGVALLNTNSISQNDLDEAEILLKLFVSEFESHYSVDNMSHNLHMCLHLVHCVKLLGPLWATSCFNFEDINGRILNLVHGTRHVGLQIHSNMSILTQLPLFIHNLRDGSVKEFCKNIKRKYRLNISETISSNLHCVGNFSDLTVDKAWVADTLEREIEVHHRTNIKLFHRLFKDKVLFAAESYKKSSRVSSYVSYHSNNVVKYGNILCFVKVVCNCSNQCVCQSKFFAIVKPVPVIPLQSDVVVFKHLFKCDSSHQDESFFNCDVVPIHDLQYVLFKIENAGSTFLSAPLNNYELE